jgi:hypothetical protein
MLQSTTRDLAGRASVGLVALALDIGARDTLLRRGMPLQLARHRRDGTARQLVLEVVAGGE